uniref:Uncharacterized protein n=1 Tax=Ovis aries TaxID=9940 RepID=A0AC11CTP0_SHEEP
RWPALQGHHKVGRRAWSCGDEGKVSVGEPAAQPGTGRLVWKSICPGRLGSDRAFIQVLYELCVLPLLQDAAELLRKRAGPHRHSIVALPQEHVAVAIHPAQPAGQRHQPIGHWPETVCNCTAEPPARPARPSEYFRRCPCPPPRRQAT